MTPSKAVLRQYKERQVAQQTTSRTRERESSCQESDTPRNALVRPATELNSTVRLRKYVFPRAPPSHCEKDNDPHEPKERMSDTANDLDRTQNPAREDVAEGWDSEKRPGKQGTMPILRNVVLIVEDYQTLSNRANEEGW